MLSVACFAVSGTIFEKLKITQLNISARSKMDITSDSDSDVVGSIPTGWARKSTIHSYKDSRFYFDSISTVLIA